MSNFVDHNWSNPETRAIAYYQYERQEEALEEIGDLNSFLSFLSPVDRARFHENIEALILAGKVSEDEMDLEEFVESILPGARVKFAAEKLKDGFGSTNLGTIRILWETGILMGGTFKYREGPSGAPTGENDQEWEETLSDSNFGLLVELLLSALDRVNWEEIVTVWLESQGDSEEPEEGGGELEE